MSKLGDAFDVLMHADSGKLKFVGSPREAINFALMSIEDAVMLMFMLTSQDATNDMKDMQEAMEATRLKRRALREAATRTREHRREARAMRALARRAKLAVMRERRRAWMKEKAEARAMHAQTLHPLQQLRKLRMKARAEARAKLVAMREWGGRAWMKAMAEALKRRREARAVRAAAHRAERATHRPPRPNRKRWIIPAIIVSGVFLLFIVGMVFLKFIFITPSITPTQPPVPPVAGPAGPAAGTLMAWVDGSTLVFYKGVWIYRSEVTNYQYSLCVEAGSCVPSVSEQPTPDGVQKPLSASLYDVSELTERPFIGTADVQQEYCSWADGRLPSAEESADIAASINNGILDPSSQTQILDSSFMGLRCIVDAPAPMAPACQTSAFYLNGPPAAMDHAVTQVAQFCQKGQGYVTLDIALPEGGSIQSVNGDCDVIGENRVLCSAEPGVAGEGSALILYSELPAIQNNGLPAAGAMQCLPGYEVNGDAPAECTIIGPGPQNFRLSADPLPSESDRRLPGGRTCGPWSRFDEATGTCIRDVSREPSDYETSEPSLPSCFGWMIILNEVTGLCEPPMFGCPVGTYFDPNTQTCIAPMAPSSDCLAGYQFDEASQCCQVELASGLYPGCPTGQAYDPSTGMCDSENFWAADGKVLHTVEFAVNVPFCDSGSGNNDHGSDDDGGGGSACPNGKDPVCDPNNPSKCYCQ